MHMLTLKNRPRDVEAHRAHGRVNFRRFLGISRFGTESYSIKGKRKYSTGEAQRRNRGVRKPMVDVIFLHTFKPKLTSLFGIKTKIWSASDLLHT